MKESSYLWGYLGGYLGGRAKIPKIPLCYTELDSQNRHDSVYGAVGTTQQPEFNRIEFDTFRSEADVLNVALFVRSFLSIAA